MKNKYSNITFITIVIFLIITNFSFFPKNIFSWDVFGYYLYLPLKFIYNDIGIQNENLIYDLIEKYNCTETFYQAVKLPQGNYVLKYPMGMAVFYAPFFFIGHFVALITNYTADGFSLPYQYSVFIGCIIYSILGIIFLLKILRYFFSDKLVAVLLVLTVFATNYIVHITMYGQNAMSHNILFLSYSLIVWLTIKWHKYQKLKYIVLLSLICGISILSRPSEIVCLSIPLFWNIRDKKTLIDKINLLLKSKKQIILFLVILLFIGLAQFLYWKIQTGSFMYYSYGANAGEGFEFLSPYTLSFLFSFRKGWLVYTPIMIFAILGFIYLYKYNKNLFIPLILYFIANLYIVSSWSCWWYAQSFSQRAIIQSYPIMMIALGYFLHHLHKQKAFIKISAYTLIVFFLLLNIFQTVQFHKGVLHTDRMTKKYYFATFGKLSVKKSDRKLLLVNRSFDGYEKFENKQQYNLKQTFKQDFESINHKNILEQKSQSGKSIFHLDSTTIYSLPIEIPYYKITNKNHAWLKISYSVYSKFDNYSNPFSLVVQFTHNEYAYKYKTFDSENIEFKVGEWNHYEYYYLTPEVRKKSNYLKTYIWLRGKKSIYIDNLVINVYQKKE